MRDVADANGERLQGSGQETDLARSEVAVAADSEYLTVPERSWGEGRESRKRLSEWEGSGGGREIDWGKYEPAIRRWEAILGRSAPPPTEFGPRGNIRLSPRFAEWMMGVPDGWIVDLGFTRKDMFRFIGNGVVPLQAALAIRGLMDEEGITGLQRQHAA